ncbi:MAG: type VI secretion system baseplate subunit TssK [Bryobacteraceae bacterium]|jgi:type VI secretion system protein ImpJ
MKHLSRLVWSEGMYLGPHHFQAQSRYFEDSVHFAIASLYFAPYGLGGFELDREALLNGTLSLVHARGVFPDGLVFQMPDADPLPPAREISELFSPVRESVTAYLAISPRIPDGLNCALGDDGESSTARYIAESVVLHDDNTGRDEKPVRVGRKNVRLLLDTELAPDMVVLPMARIRRDGTGHFVFDPQFIPPSLEISASERLMVMLRRLIEILEDKSSNLTRAKLGGAKSSAGWSSQEVANFWFLHCVNASLAPLRHFCFTRRGHPEALFVELLRLAGALCTFGLDSHPRSLPLYDHQNLQECFEALDEHIRRHLELLMPTNCIPIPLTPMGNYYWSGPVPDQRCLGGCRWIFAIRSKIGEGDLIERTPRLVKICSKDFVPRLVQRALPGLSLTQIPIPPAAISPRLETQYFAANRAGPCWDHIVLTRQVGVYVPGEIPQPEIELLVVLES